MTLITITTVSLRQEVVPIVGFPARLSSPAPFSLAGFGAVTSLFSQSRRILPSSGMTACGDGMEADR